MLALKIGVGIGALSRHMVAVAAQNRVKIGANISGVGWYGGARHVNSVLAYAGPQDGSSYAYVNDPGIVNANGEFVTIPAQGIVVPLGPPMKSGTTRFRYEYTGTGAVTPVSATSGMVDTITSGVDTTVSPNVHWVEWNLNFSDLTHWTLQDLSNLPHTLTYTSMNPADPIRNEIVSEVVGVTSNGGTRTAYVTTSFWHPSFIALGSLLHTIRFMDLNETNNNWRPDKPTTAANRARLRSRRPTVGDTGTHLGYGAINFDSPGKCVFGSGSAQITVLPVYFMSQGYDYAGVWAARATAGVTPIEVTPFGTTVNLMSVKINAASGGGSVSFDPGLLRLTITPASGANSAAAVCAQANAFVDGNSQAKTMFMGTGAIPAYSGFQYGGDGTGQVTAGIYNFSGGVDGAANGMLGVEEAVDLCNQTNTHMHYNVPMNADDTWLAFTSDYIATHLAAGLNVTYEATNEPWNAIFDVGVVNFAQAKRRNVYGVYAATSGDYDRTSHARYLEFIAHMRAVFDANMHGRAYRVAFNVQQGYGFANSYIDYISRVNTTTAPIFNAKVDLLVTAPYYTDSFFDPGPWVSGSTYPVDTVKVDPSNGFTYIAKAALTGATTQPHSDTNNWVRASTDLDRVARIVRSNIDATVARFAADRAYYATALGKPLETYECGAAFQVGTDPALAMAMQGDARSYDLEAYFQGEMRAVAPDAVVLQFALQAIGSTQSFQAIRYATEIDANAPKWAAIKDALAGHQKPYFKSGAVPTMSAPIQAGRPLVLTATANGRYSTTTTLNLYLDGTLVASGPSPLSYTPGVGDIGKVPTGSQTITNAYGTATSATVTGAAVVQLKTTKVLTATGAGSFTLPSDWPGTGTINVGGAGGNGWVPGNSGYLQGSGGSGGFSRATITGAVGDVVPFFIAAGGSGQQTYWKDTATAMARAGTNATNVNPGSGGAAGIGGLLTRAGTDGSTGNNYFAGSGSPGAPGPEGLGGSSVPSTSFAGTPGGGANGGSNASGSDRDSYSAGANRLGNGAGHCSRDNTATDPPTQGVNGGGAGSVWGPDGSDPNSEGGWSASGLNATYEARWTDSASSVTVGPGGGASGAFNGGPATFTKGKGGNGKFGSGGAGGPQAGGSAGGDGYIVLEYYPG